MASLARLAFGLHVLCRKCKGEGRLPVHVKSASGKWYTEHVPCKRCNAAGYMLILDGREVPDPFSE